MTSWTEPPSVVVSTARVRSSFPGLGGLKETKMFLSHPLVKLNIVRSLRDREVACSASDLQGLNFESCVWRAVSSHSSHHLQEVLLAQFSLYVHKCGLKRDSFHFYWASWLKQLECIHADFMLDYCEIQHCSSQAWFYHCDIHPLQAANLCRNSRLVVEED